MREKRQVQEHAGDKAAEFDALYQAHWEVLYKIANKKTGAAEDALDIVQDTFTYVWQNFSSLQLEASKERAYLITCLYYRIFRFLRSKGLQEKHYDHFAVYLGEEAVQPEQALELEMELQAIYAAIAVELEKMPQRMRRIFVMSRYENRSHQEIATELSISTKTVKNQLSDALGRLKDFAQSSPDIYLPLFLLVLSATDELLVTIP